MPTYQIGDAEPADPRPLVPKRPLTCVQCGAVLGLSQQSTRMRP
jgi:hypothetical protein